MKIQKIHDHIQRVREHVKNAPVEKKHHFLMALSFFVLALHWINPDFEAFGFAITGVLATELA